MSTDTSRKRSRSRKRSNSRRHSNSRRLSSSKENETIAYYSYEPTPFYKNTIFIICITIIYIILLFIDIYFLLVIISLSAWNNMIIQLQNSNIRVKSYDGRYYLTLDEKQHEFNKRLKMHFYIYVGIMVFLPICIGIFLSTINNKNLEKKIIIFTLLFMLVYSIITFYITIEYIKEPFIYTPI